LPDLINSIVRTEQIYINTPVFSFFYIDRHNSKRSCDAMIDVLVWCRLLMLCKVIQLKVLVWY